jgi:hypothetical protein
MNDRLHELSAESLTELDELQACLRTDRRRLDSLWQDRPMLWQALGWNRAQLRLWLRSLPGIGIEQGETDNPRYTLAAGDADAGSGEDLGELIARVVAALGRPVPLGQLRTKLPPGTVATEAMMRAAIQTHPKLTLTGPLVRWLK